jgi:predicted RND superfamily exporter protein/lauroyl/myristoyl acyltransferase
MTFRKWLLLAFGLLVIVGLSRLRLDVDVLNLLPAELPVVQGLRAHQQHFANARELIITLKTTDAALSEDAARSLATELRNHTNVIGRAIWQPPWQEDALGASELVAYLWLNSDTNVVQKLEERFHPDKLSAQLTKVREQLATSFSPESVARSSYDPLDLLNVSSGDLSPDDLGSNQLFASADGTFRLLHVDPATPLKDYHEATRWLDEVRGLIQQWRQTDAAYAPVEVRLTGGPAFMSEIATSMETDMRQSMPGSLALIAIVFLIAHRRLKPLFWLVVILGANVILTIAIGGLLFGRMNVISLGFAAILFGMVVDFALVLYQEGITSGKTPDEIRAEIAPGIWWSGISTAAAFAALNFGGLPGLAQLGTLVAAGILTGAWLVLHFFPRVIPLAAPAAELQSEKAAQIASGKTTPSKFPRFGLVSSIVILLVAVVILQQKGVPGLTASSEPLRPRNSGAYDAMDQLKTELGRTNEPVLLVISGDTDAQVSARLLHAEKTLKELRDKGLVRDALLPLTLWPQPAQIAVNREKLHQLAADSDRIRQAFLNAGFAESAFRVTELMLRYWSQQGTELHLPTGSTPTWILEQVIVRRDKERYALGIITPASSGETAALQLSEALDGPGARVAGWELLGISILRHVQGQFIWVTIPCSILLLLSLWMAFRRWSEVMLSIGTLLVSGFLMLAFMRLFGWSWNLLNLMALPLLLGSAEDYSIHLQLALRRARGDWRETWHSTGKAVLLCSATTIIGFGSLAFSRNAGLASLGQVCSLGIVCAMIVSLLLLPSMWQLCAGPIPEKKTKAPSQLYRLGWWKAGLWLGKNLPEGLVSFVARSLSRLYATFNSNRFAIVENNLRPLLGADSSQLHTKAMQLFNNFGQKLVDLWRYESGADVKGLFGEWTGWEHFESAQKKGKGVLLITPHLGNWEFGGPLLTQRDVKLLVLTQAEPGDGFTELRQQSRERWGIETLVVGRDAFAFVEVIKRLQEGACVALLVDRPPPGTEVEVQLCGEPFLASISAAELARATGCAILPTAIVRDRDNYAAHILPELTYQRAELNNREARLKFTQQIIRAFEPLLKQYPEQWYHFVSIWPSRRG